MNLNSNQIKSNIFNIHMTNRNCAHMKNIKECRNIRIQSIAVASNESAHV